ncbi:hypothetical protein TrLO_g439 [Triparma laevis f. longispina]|uniref:MFS general substrate transporter n=1 Tax=Triparma laevis f. longispina TaxID=1714387 RepID=A0A9W7AGA9_9STRA|nr:hypothetical protein TrLO_g439 [Triparma laevis f. longispina]
MRTSAIGIRLAFFLLVALLRASNGLLPANAHMRPHSRHMRVRGGSQPTISTTTTTTLHDTSEPQEFSELAPTEPMSQPPMDASVAPPSPAPPAPTPKPAYLPSITLFLTYMCTMGSKCALPLAIPQRYPPVFPAPALLSKFGIGAENILSCTLLCSTLAISCTKAMSGSVIDKLGGETLLILVLPLLSLSFFFVSSTSVYASAPFLIIIDIIFAVIWPSLISMISRSRPGKKQAKDISSLVVGGRAGMAIMFGLGGFTNGNSIFRFASMAAACACSSVFFGRYRRLSLAAAGGALPTKIVPPPTNLPQSRSFAPSPKLKNVLKTASTLNFFLFTVTRTLLLIFGSFVLFVPSYLASFEHLPKSLPAGSFYSLGCIAGIMASSRKWSKWSREKRKWVAGGSCILSFLSAISLLYPPFINPYSVLLIMFLWGSSFVTPFYLPPTIYVLKVGKKQGTVGTLDNLFDLWSFLALAVFNSRVANCVGGGGWDKVIMGLAGSALVSGLCVFTAIHREDLDEE